MENKNQIELFTQKIKDNVPFSFIKHGDGEMLCELGAVGHNCDLHDYSPELGQKLRDAFAFFASRGDCFVPLFENQEYFNTLLHRVDKDNSQIRNFYNEIRKSNHKKTFVGPKRLGIVAKLLGAEHIIVPDVNCFNKYEEIMAEIRKNIVPSGDNIFMFSAGMPSKVMIAEILRQPYSEKYTCLDLGSAFDSLIGQTRTNQLPRIDMFSLYSEMIFDLL